LLIGALQIITACGLFVLMYGERASTMRIVLGISIVLIGWLSVQTVNAVDYLMPKIRAASEANLDTNSPGDRSINDTGIGVSADLPDGWMQIKVAGVLAHQKARMVFMNNSVGAQAALRIQDISPSAGTTTSVDYLNSVTRNAQRSILTFKNLGISPSSFGQILSGDPPKRMEISFESDEGGACHGWISVCKRGNTFYQLSVQGSENDKDRVYSEYLKLESAFTIEK
jgi:hypothetical protein